MNVGSVVIPIRLDNAVLDQQVKTATDLINGLIGPANNIQTVMAGIFSGAAIGGFLDNFNFLKADLMLWIKINKDLIGGTSALTTVLNNISIPSSLITGLTNASNQLIAVKNQLQSQLGSFTSLSNQIIESAGSLSQGQGINPIMGPGMQMGPSVSTMLDVGQGVEEYVGFEKIANSFRAMAMAGGESTESINAVMEETKRLGAVTSKTPTAVVGLAGELSKLGFTSESVSKSLEGITKTSEATGEDLTQVGSVVAVALSSFKIPSEKTSLVSDKMASIANASATSILAIGESMKYVGTSAYGANQSLDTTLVSLGLLSNAGIEGSAAGTGLSVAITNLQKAAASAKGSLGELNAETAKLTEADLKNLTSGSQEGDSVFSGSADSAGASNLQAKALNSLGLDKKSLLDASGNLRQLTDIIPTIRNKIEQLKTTAEGTSKVPILINAIFGQQGGRTIQALLGQTDADIARLMQSAKTAEGFSAKVSQVMLGGLSGSLEQLAGSVQTVSLIVGEFFAPAFKMMVDATLSVVNAFASLPAPVRNFALSLSVVVPLAILYWKAILASKSIVQAYTTLTIGLTLAKTALGRTELVNISITAIAEAKSRALLFIYGAQAFILNVLTGRTTLQAAVNIILAGSIRLATTAYSVNVSTLNYGIVTVFESIRATIQLTVSIGLWITGLNTGIVSVARVNTLQGIYALVTGRATTANLGFIASTAVLIARFAIIAAAAWAVSQAWNSFTSGTKEASGIQKTADDINKLTKEITGLQVKAEESGNVFQRFWAKVQQKGPIEAVQQGLSKVTGGLPNDTYGKDFGIVTNSQLAAQRAMFATAEVSKAVNTQLDMSIGVMQKYGVETLDASDKQRLGAKGITDFTTEAKGQVEMLGKTLDVLKAQQPVNDEQKAFIQTNIKLTEQQIQIFRNKIVALESENAVTKVHILTLDELTQKYKNVAHASELANLTATASIEEAAAKSKNSGGISQEEKTKRLSVLGKTEINERVQSNDSKLKDLKAASIGATTEDATKIAEEIKKIEIDQVKARIDSAKYEQQERKTLNDDLLASNKELEDAVTAKQQLSSQNQITAIRKAQAARTYSAEEAATKIRTIETADLQASIASETEKQRKLNQLRQWGVISEEEARKGLRDSVSEAAKIQGQIVEAGLKKTEEQSANQLKSIKDRENSLATAQELSSQTQITAIKKAQAAKVYSAEEAAAKIGAIETADLQDSINREVQKQQNLKQLQQRGIISEEEARKGIGEAAILIAKTQGQLAEAEIKKSEERVAARVKAIEEQVKFSKLKPEQELARLDAQSFGGDQQGKIATAQSGVGDARSELDKQRLGFALQLAELNNNQSQQEQIKGQIYQQQLVSLTQQQESKRQELALSQQQQTIELERKKIQSELAVLEAQSALQTAQAQGASAAELAGLQQSIALKQQIVSQVATEQVNQGKLNSLSNEQLAIQQQTAKEGVEQQRQIDLERQAIEKKTKAIEEGLNRARALSEVRSQGLEFKGQDIGAEISKQKLLADISQSQSNLQKQRLEFSLQSAELTGNEANKEQIKQQIYQQQLTSMAAQHEAQRTSLDLSNQQAVIELERKRIQGEISVLEAQANLQTAEVKNASAAEVESLQSVLDLRQKSLDYISTEEANQSKINQLTGQHLAVEQQIAKEGLEQQQQLDLQRESIEKRTKAIEDGLIRARTAMEGKSQNLEFKGQTVGGEIDKQKWVTDLQQSQAALQKQQLDFALQRAELAGNESAKEQIKEQIYQQQKAALIAQQQAQIVGIGLSRQQAAIELERQKLSAQVALTEAQANVAKAQVTKTTSAAEMEALRATVGYRQQSLGQITAQATVSKQVQSTEDQKLAIERQTTMENMVQTRELERQKQAIEKQKQAIEERLQAQKSGLENRQGKLELSNQLLDLESRQLSARSGLTEAVNGLEQQRLEFLMSQAEITGNTAQKESLKTQLYQQQLVALDRSQQAQQHSFEISQKQKQIELDKQEIQAKIATFEAEANIAKAKADKSSAQQISALEAVYKLRQDSLSQIGRMRTVEGQIVTMERQKLSVEQLSAREKLRQTNQLEKMRQVYEANNKAIEKTNSLEKERSAQQSSDTSGGLSWVDKAKPAWFEGATNSFQKATEAYLLSSASPPSDLAPVAPTTPVAPVVPVNKTPDTPQQLANMQIAAQNVYLTGAIAEAKNPADEQLRKEALSQLGQMREGYSVNPANTPIVPTQPMDANAQREAAKAKIEQAQIALSEAIARANAQKPIDPQEATRQGAIAGQAAKEYAAQIRADLQSGVLKNQVTGKTVALNLPPSLTELAANLTKAQTALKEIKDPVTLESIYKLMGEIKEMLGKQSFGNLTVVSQNPVAECSEILNALITRRK
ncbi:MAG: hypothetical protein EAZ18_00210 [Oscillatoriales cyanobacterium]|nr:MAG: hypothetical protein EAZ18_00210 [Oscillatoriales cyanobacterium]